ncbi:uncharacterized protein [Heterodontus francisci]|uniref:uncharacterized protein n=1 Tax=Heterodontus francisci TaxID=7792 RepID=UPI00355BAEC2
MEPMLYCLLLMLWLVLGVIQADSVSQPLSALYINEGDTMKIDCSYITSLGNPDLYWYRQHMNLASQFILSRDSNSKRDADFAKGKFEASQTNAEKKFPLTITGAEIQDTAVYFCALSSTLPDATSETLLKSKYFSEKEATPEREQKSLPLKTTIKLSLVQGSILAHDARENFQVLSKNAIGYFVSIWKGRQGLGLTSRQENEPMTVQFFLKSQPRFYAETFGFGLG